MARIISYDRGCCCEREKEREILRGRDSARRIDATKKARYESAASRRRGDVPDESKRERERELFGCCVVALRFVVAASSLLRHLSSYARHRGR